MKGPIIRTGGRAGMFLFLIPFSVLFTNLEKKFTGEKTAPVIDPTPFGMRLRTFKPGAEIFAPTIVAEAPTNEATMVRLHDTTLKTFYINRPGSANQLMSILSEDNGRSWQAPRVEFTLPGEAYYANQVLLGPDNELHCVFHIFGTGQNGYRNRHLNLWYCRTENNQQTWTKPQEIYNGYVGSMRGFIQLRNGRLLLPFARAVPSREQRPQSGTDYGWNEIITLFSDDNGDSWHQSDNSLNIAIDGSMTTRYGGVEPCIIALQDRRIWMLIRTTKGRLYQSYSEDNGKSWSPPEATRFISSDSPATFLRLSDNRLLLLWNANQRWDDPRSYAMGGRQILHAAISHDDGRTWKGFREVLSVPAKRKDARGDKGTAYPSAVETADGNVAFVSGQGAEKSIVLFDPQWLEESSASDNFSEGLVQWTLYGADSLTALTRSPKGNALHLRKSNNRKYANTEAVWNFPMTPKGELTAEIEMKANSKGIYLALTDHFSIAGDTLASEHGVVQFISDEQIMKIARAKKNRLSIRIAWDVKSGSARISINGKPFAEKTFSREPIFGLNHLRVGIPGTDEDLAGFIVHSVKMNGSE